MIDNIIKATGIEKLNAMQETIRATDARNVLLLAPTGSGKTIAFLIFLQRHLGSPEGILHGIIIAPTRELALQITDVARKCMSGYRIITLYGGHALRDEENAIAGSHPDIIVATPGRLLDHLSRGNINTETVKVAVVDEMDKCLDLGFMPDIKKILRSASNNEYLLLSSATMPDDSVFSSLTIKHRTLSIKDFDIYDFSQSVADIPRLDIVEIPSATKDKIETLETLLDALDKDDKTIVFLNHRESAERVFQHLKQDGFPVVLYHGALDQQDREIALQAFTNGTLPVLIATDLASRGLDLPSVENVIHYHMPMSAETWTHRNGRTGRAGASGKVFVIEHGEENIPDYVTTHRQWYPKAARCTDQRSGSLTTAVINLGKKDKISRADILGFLTKQLCIPGNEVGKINVSDRYSTIAVPKSYISSIKSSSKSLKIKNKKFRANFL